MLDAGLLTRSHHGANEDGYGPQLHERYVHDVHREQSRLFCDYRSRFPVTFH